jgi:hypothetical protein
LPSNGVGKIIDLDLTAEEKVMLDESGEEGDRESPQPPILTERNPLQSPETKSR